MYLSVAREYAKILKSEAFTTLVMCSSVFRLTMLRQTQSLIGTLFTLVGIIFNFFFYAIVALIDWLKVFPLIDKWFTSFFLPKVVVVVVGLLVTPIPLIWLLIISFLPPGIVFSVFFVAFIYAFAHF